MAHTRLITHPNSNSPLRLGLVFSAGGLYQPAGKEGVSHLLEHILAHEISKLDMDFYAHTTKDAISFSFTSYDPLFLDKHWGSITKAIYHSSFSNGDIKREKQAIGNELANFAMDYPNTNQVKLHDFLATGVWSEQLDGLVEGSTKTRESLTSKDLLEFRHRYFVAPKAIIAVANSATLKKISPGLININNYGNSDKNPSLLDRLSTTAITSPTVLKDKTRANQAGEQNFIGVGWKQDYLSLSAYLSQLIMFRAATSYGSRLMSRLRLALPFVYKIELDTDIVASELSLFSLHTSCSPEHTQRVIEEITKYIASDPKSEQDFSRELNRMKLMAKSITDGSENTYNFLSYYQKIGITPKDYIAAVKQLTMSDIKTQQANFTKNNYAVVIS